MILAQLRWLSSSSADWSSFCADDLIGYCLRLKLTGAQSGVTSPRASGSMKMTSPRMPKLECGISRPGWAAGNCDFHRKYRKCWLNGSSSFGCLPAQLQAVERMWFGCWEMLLFCAASTSFDLFGGCCNHRSDRPRCFCSRPQGTPRMYRKCGRGRTASSAHCRPRGSGGQDRK